MSVKIEMTGRVFGDILVLGEQEDRGQSREMLWKCLCSCGKVFTTRGSFLRNRETVSCGCHRIKTFIKRNTTHGKCNTPTYRVWGGMIQRCTNPANARFKDYGGRGITVCDRWNTKTGGSFENFYEDMGDRPKGLSLERIDNDLGYFKENCRWATASEQSANQRIKASNKSGVTGVYWCSTKNRWKAEIKRNKKRVCLGSFISFEEAVHARKSAELFDVDTEDAS